MNFNKILQSLFGNKSTRDMKLIQPIVEKVKAEYPKMNALSNDELRAKTKEIQKYVQEYAKEEKAKIAELKAKIEDTPIDEREGIFNQIDKLEQEALDKYEIALNEVLPQVFAIVKDTARRFAENEETVVTATDFDRELASDPKNDFVTIDGDKAIYHNHWTAGGNDMKWEMIHYDVQLFGGVVLHQGKIAKAGIYQMTINMMDYTYSIKQIAPEYYLVGALQSWSDQNMSCLMTAETAMVQNFTTKWTGDANLKIWLGSDFGKWDNAFGSASGDGVSAAEGKLKANGGAIVCPEKDAYYTFTADFSTMTYKWTKLANQNPTEFKYVSLIGVGGKWKEGDDIDLKQVAPHNWYLAKQEIPAGGLKIRAVNV